MKKIVLNDGRTTEVQSISQNDGTLKIRMILKTSEQLKALFLDTFATSKITLYENMKEIAVYENYTILQYIKEENGGIWEVQLNRTEADFKSRLALIETEMNDMSVSFDEAIIEFTRVLEETLGGV